MMPPFCRYMNRNRKATTTNGTAQGVSSSARIARKGPPPMFSVSSASASPKSAAMATLPKV
jgi:hypothetical protein